MPEWMRWMGWRKAVMWYAPLVLCIGIGWLLGSASLGAAVYTLGLLAYVMGNVAYVAWVQVIARRNPARAEPHIAAAKRRVERGRASE